MSIVSIAVLITCFNRKENTLKCFSHLFAQALPKNVKFKVYLVDDASTDGTQDAVNEKFLDVEIIQGHGSLFWNGGMRLAFEHAASDVHDFYLWLNDDTYLYDNALNELLRTFEDVSTQNNKLNIVVGSTQDPETGSLTYGGVDRYSWWYPLKFSHVQPEDSPKRCDTMHGNCVLIHKSVASLLGNLDPNFVHHLSDFDYGFRASQQGCSVWIAPGFIGTCSFHGPAWREKNASLDMKLKRINHPKGLRLSEWKIYSQRHAGPLWPIYWLIPYIKFFVTSVFGV